ncbi:MAG: UPF0262 family protein [Xanthobacteraceae bacterium]|nr:UPF0262 family protein [Xanthobacteraceae bacterium]
MTGNADPNKRLASVKLDERSIGRSNPDVEHERSIAIFDLIESNYFEPVGDDGGPYALNISLSEQRLVLAITREGGDEVITHILSLSPLRKVVRDYFMICDSYYAAIKTETPQKIEAIDMGRRGLHDEGSRILAERLKEKVSIDFDTARRLFTLICALHWKG